MTRRALSRYELWYGRDEPPLTRTALRAGTLTAYLEGIDLRDLRLGGVELVRRLGFTLRDENWDTIPPEVANLEFNAGEDSFLVEFEARHRTRDLDFRWHGTIRGDCGGSISYRMDGQALRDFRYCRIGFCVLHPTEYAGRFYRGVTPGGSVTGQLPITVGPQRYEGGFYFALFDAVSALQVSLADQVEARFEFEGDLFEMEDQRNWGDGSFKTYCTPMALGYPFLAKTGQAFTQRVAISASGEVSGPAFSRESFSLSLGEPLGRKLPKLGLGTSTHDLEFSEADEDLLGRLQLDHLRVDLNLNDLDWPRRLDRAERESGALGTSLELALFLTSESDPGLPALESRLPLASPISRVLVFHENEPTTNARLLDQVRARIAPHLPGVPIGGGTNLNFADLNRERPDPSGLDVVAYSINPQVHARDETSLIENLEAQRDTVTTARSFCGQLPVVISPVTLRPRFNPDAVGPEPPPRPGELPAAVDPRQMSLFAACWALGSVKQLAEGGADSVTYFETTGWRGLKETDAGCLVPEQFLSSPGMVFPVYHVFAAIADLKAADLIACQSSEPLGVQCLAFRTHSGLHLLVANLTCKEQACVIEPLTGAGAKVRSLNADTAPLAMAQPLEFRSQSTWIPLDGSRGTFALAPYSFTRIDAEEA